MLIFYSIMGYNIEKNHMKYRGDQWVKQKIKK